MKNHLKLMLWLTLLGASSAYALDPFTMVQDAKMLEATLNQIKEIQSVRDKLSDQLNTLNQQKNILEDSQKLMQGHYEYSSKFDMPELSQWRHSGKDWSSFMNSNEGQGTDSLTTYAKQIEKEFPVKSSSSVYGKKNSEQAKLFDLLSKTTLASRASNTLAYNTIDNQLSMLEELQKEIERSPNQKATLDLIARIQIEEAKMTAYKIKSDAVSAQLVSLQSQQEVSDAKWAGEFFKWQK